jgi:hypothetical protein
VLWACGIVGGSAEARAYTSKKGGAGVYSWRTIKTHCDKQTCWHLPEVEADNCVLQCQSPSCYAETYADAPLEPGEVDYKRSTAYQRCLQEQEKSLRLAKLWPPKIDPDTGRLKEPEPER